jgi:hypothetical protein
MEAENSSTNGVVFRDSFIIGSLSIIEKLLSVAAEETLDIYWSFSKLSYHIETSPFHDSVYVTRNDTTAFLLSF